ncbi:MAG: hypothetical protein GSR72_04230 [Desulfurococcales archaeon]|nr:hypothetical protein [Desulfurococcales archaeon]
MSVDEIKERMRKEIEELVRQGRYGDIPGVISKYLPELSKAGSETSGSTGKTPMIVKVPGCNDDKDDAEELREVLSAVSDFLKDIEGPIKKLIDLFFGALDGEKLGKEVATFYKSLIDSGMPKELAAEMTKEYFEKRTRLADIIKGFQGLAGLKEGLAPFMKASGNKEENQDTSKNNNDSGEGVDVKVE